MCGVLFLFFIYTHIYENINKQTQLLRHLKTINEEQQKTHFSVALMKIPLAGIPKLATESAFLHPQIILGLIPFSIRKGI